MYDAVVTETQKYGILEVDDELRVTCMKEKPAASETTSRRAVSSLVGSGEGERVTSQTNSILSHEVK